MPPPDASVPITVRLPQDLADRLADFAKKTDRSVGGAARHAIRQLLTKEQ